MTTNDQINKKTTLLLLLICAGYLFAVFVTSIIIVTLLSKFVSINLSNNVDVLCVFAFLLIYYIIDLGLAFFGRLSPTKFVLLMGLIIVKGFYNIFRGQESMTINFPSSLKIEQYMMKNIWCKIFNH